ncbi:MAG: hypothetical protein WAJ92_06095 [Candidatus Acidiferrales bacterium]
MNVEPKDIIIAVLGSGVGLAGILLVFIGFIYSHAETFASVPTRKKYRLVGRLGLIPFAFSLLSAWCSLRWLQASGPVAYCWSIRSFELCLILTFLYGTITLIFYL